MRASSRRAAETRDPAAATAWIRSTAFCACTASASAALAAASGVSAAFGRRGRGEERRVAGRLLGEGLFSGGPGSGQRVGRGLLGLRRLIDGRVGRGLGRRRLRRELLGGLERGPRVAGRGDLRLEHQVELLDRRVLLRERLVGRRDLSLRLSDDGLREVAAF